MIINSNRGYSASISPTGVIENKTLSKIPQCIETEIYTKKIYLHLRLNPDDVQPVEGITKDVREIGHWGTGDLEIVIRSMKDFEKIKPLIYKAYEEN